MAVVKYYVLSNQITVLCYDENQILSILVCLYIFDMFLSIHKSEIT